MAKKKGKGRRNAGSPRGGGKKDGAAKNIAIAVGGGALGALAAGVAVGSGANPKTAAVATLAAGALGAWGLKGPAKVAAIGAACAASGQLALAWQVRRRAEQAAKDQQKKEVAMNDQQAPQQLPVGQQPAPQPGKRNAAPHEYDPRDDDEYDDPRNRGDLGDEYEDDLAEAA